MPALVVCDTYIYLVAPEYISYPLGRCLFSKSDDSLASFGCSSKTVQPVIWLTVIFRRFI